MSLEDDVVAIMESVADRRTAAGLIVKLVRATVGAESVAELRAAAERGKAERREAERVRKADYRARRSRVVPGTDGDGTGQTGIGPVLSQGQTGTGRDLVPPLDPPSPSDPLLSSDPDPERAIPPALLVFPVVGGTNEWALTETLRDQHQAAFPDLDVMAEYRRALARVQGNPAKRKTAKGMPDALFRWLANSQNAGLAARQPPPPAAAPAPRVEKSRPKPAAVPPQPKTPPETRGWALANGGKP